MSNLRRDDNTYGMPWVRCAGPLAVCLYQAAEDYCHRELSGATIPRSELEIALPWPLRAGELDAAIELLIRLDRFHPIEGGFFLPRYFLEQESDEDQKSTRAKQVSAGKSRAATAERDAKGRMKPKPAKVQPVAGSSSQTLDSGSSPPASGPSGPGHPRHPGLEEAASPPPSPSAPDLPAGKPPKESPEQTVQRFMTTPPRNDDGQDRVWRYYATRFFVECGSLPTYPKKRNELNALKDLCVGHGPEEVCRRLGIYFDDPPWGLHDGGRDLERFFKNFDKLAVGSGKHARREKSDRSLKFQFAMREKLAGLNGHGPILAPEYRDWIKADPAPAPQPISSPRGDERFALTTPEEDPRDPF